MRVLTLSRLPGNSDWLHFIGPQFSNVVLIHDSDPGPCRHERKSQSNTGNNKTSWLELAATRRRDKTPQTIQVTTELEYEKTFANFSWLLIISSIWNPLRLVLVHLDKIRQIGTYSYSHIMIPWRVLVSTYEYMSAHWQDFNIGTYLYVLVNSTVSF